MFTFFWKKDNKTEQQGRKLSGSYHLSKLIFILFWFSVIISNFSSQIWVSVTIQAELCVAVLCHLYLDIPWNNFYLFPIYWTWETLESCFILGLFVRRIWVCLVSESSNFLTVCIFWERDRWGPGLAHFCRTSSKSQSLLPNSPFLSPENLSLVW